MHKYNELPPQLGGDMTFRYGKQSADGTFNTALKTNASSCFKGIPLKWEIFFSSNYGTHNLELEFPQQENSTEALASIDGLESYVMTEVPVSQEDAEKICSKSASVTNIEIAETNQSQQIFSILKKIAPECNFKMTDRGLYCSQKTISKRTALSNVRKLKRSY